MENQTPQQQIDTIYETRIKLKRLKFDYENEKEQLHNDFEKYCISISPYKIGDKFTDDNLRITIIIDCIRPHYWVLDEDYRMRYSWQDEILKYPFTYEGYRINSTGKPSKSKRAILFPSNQIKKI